MATSRHNRWARIGCLILIMVLSERTAQAWYDKVHVLIVLKAAELLRRSEGTSWYAGFLGSRDVLMQLAEGASDEDYTPSVRGNERSFRHYYDPDAPVGQQGVKFYRHFYVWIPVEGAEVTHPLFVPGREGMISDNTLANYDGTLAWAIQDDLGNDRNWPAAILAYRTKSPESKLLAYNHLGRVAHLLGDMSEPDHVVNRSHPGSGYLIPRDIDQKIFTPKTVGKLKALLGELGVSESAVEEFRQAVLRHPLVANRYAIGFEGLIESLVPFSQVQAWFPDRPGRKREYNLPTDGYSLNIPWGTRSAECGDIIDCFNNLARSTKRAAAASKLSVPLGLEDAGGLLSAAIQQAAGTQAVAQIASDFGISNPTDWGARVAAALYEPIHIIPAIDLKNASAAYPYMRLAGGRLNEGTEYVAALLKLFHEIVREPPMVGQVTLSQDGGGSYSALFRRPTGSDGRRQFEIQKSIPFISGKPVKVELRFADSFGDIEPNSVKVALVSKGPGGGTGAVSTTVAGRLLLQEGSWMSEDKWEGSFTPTLPLGSGDTDLNIVIQAKDPHTHYPRLGLPVQGYDLDSDPRTVATSSEKSPYTWQGYESGADRNHWIVVKAERNQVATITPGNRGAAPSEQGTFSGGPDPDVINAKVEDRKKRNITATFESDPITLTIQQDGRAAITRNVVFTGSLEYGKGQISKYRATFTLYDGSGRNGFYSGDMTWFSEEYHNSSGSEWKKYPPAKGTWRITRQKDGTYRLRITNGFAGVYDDIPYRLQ